MQKIDRFTNAKLVSHYHELARCISDYNRRPKDIIEKEKIDEEPELIEYKKSKIRHSQHELIMLEKEMTNRKIPVINLGYQL